MPACLSAQIARSECAPPAYQRPSTSHRPLKYPPHRCRRRGCLESRAKGSDERAHGACLRLHARFFDFLDPTNRCRPATARCLAHHPHHALQIWEAKFTCHAGRYISWKGMAVPMLSCTTWPICGQLKQNSWLCPLKADQHHPSFLCSQGAVCSEALALGWLRNSILLTSTELTF